MNTQEFMQRVEAKRIELGISIMRLCEEVDVYRASYYDWRDGSREIALQTALKISLHLNVPIQAEHDDIDWDDINHHRHTQLLESEPAYTYIEELLAEGMTVQDVAVAFQTSPKQMNKILLINRTKNDDTYKRKLR